MINPENYLVIGYISKYFGNKNEFLICQSDSGLIINEQPNYIFLLLDGYLVPFAVESFRVEDRGILVVFEDYNQNNERISLINISVYLPKQCVSFVKEKFSFKDLINYTVFNSNRQMIGNVHDYEDIIGNPNLVVNYNNREVLIPFNEELLIDLDHNNKVIIMDIPDGLLDIQ
ncbi:MAG: hypothetical protein Kow0068_14450 [Marinilabiliales bacterium]